MCFEFLSDTPDSVRRLTPDDGPTITVSAPDADTVRLAVEGQGVHVSLDLAEPALKALLRAIQDVRACAHCGSERWPCPGCGEMGCDCQHGGSPCYECSKPEATR